MKDKIVRFWEWILHGIPKNNVTTQLSTLLPHNELKGKVILVTGGGAGLGKAIAEKYISEGAKVIITGRNEEKLKCTCSELGSSCNYVKYDNADVNNLSSFVECVYNLHNKLDGIVCNAGISLHESNFLNVSVDGYDAQFNINLRGTFFLLQYLIKKTININGSLTAVVISSERGMQCDDIPYGLTKTALNSLVQGISRRYYRNNIRINGIAPGVTASEMTKIKEDSNLYQPLMPSGRFFVPSEVAEVALFLMSSKSKCISGEIIATDAGFYISSYF